MLLGAVEAERSSAADTPAPQLKLVGEGAAPRVPSATRWVPRFAMAAGLLLVVGGVSFFVVKAISLSSRPIVEREIADNRHTGPDPLAIDAAKSSTSESAGAAAAAIEGTTLADGGTPKQGDVPEVASSVPLGASVAMASAAHEPTPDLKGVPLERAAELAAEGRLAIRVVTSDTRGLAAFEQAGAAALNSPNRPWRVSKQVPAQIVANVLPSVLPRSSGLDDPRMLAAEMVAPMAGLAMHPFLATTSPDNAFSRVRASYLVSVPATETGLDLLRTALRTRLKGAVEFFELAEPIAAPSVDTPRDLLWWTQSPAQWTPRATVPTVVAAP
jgi:hypothetical protein